MLPISLPPLQALPSDCFHHCHFLKLSPENTCFLMPHMSQTGTAQKFRSKQRQGIISLVTILLGLIQETNVKTKPSAGEATFSKCVLTAKGSPEGHCRSKQ